MGTGIDAALGDNPEMRAAMENLRDQLLLVLLRRLGGEVNVPVAEIDRTGQYTMEMQLDSTHGIFTFTVRKKS